MLSFFCIIERGDYMRTLILGDSITEGELGFDYIHLLENYDIHSKGIGGETLFGLTEWMFDEILKEEYDQIIIAIGHNDIILPILKTMGSMFVKPYLSLIQRGSIPTEDPVEFEGLYRKVIKSIKEVSKTKIAVTTLSTLNENKNSLSARRRLEYNSAIRGMSDICDVIDLGRRFDEELEQLETRDYFLMTSGVSFILDKLLTKKDFGSNKLSKKRGLHFTMDGIHLNEAGALIYKEEISEFLKKSG